MKKLLSTAALSILLVSLASVSYGQNVEAINYANGDVYVGEIRNGQRSGQGTYTYGPGEFEGDVFYR